MVREFVTSFQEKTESMSLSITCSHCERKLNLRDELAGKKVRCPDCSEVISIPAQSQPSLDDDEPAPPRRMPPRIKRSEPAPPKRRRRPVEDEYLPDMEDEEEERIPGRRRKKKGSQINLGSILMAMVRYTLVAFGLLVVMTVAFGIAMFVPLLFLGVGLLVCAVGQIWLVIVPFEDGALEGLLCMFLPFYGIYYMANNFDRMKEPLVVALAGWFLMVLGACAGAAPQPPKQGWGAFPRWQSESPVCCVVQITSEVAPPNVG